MGAPEDVAAASKPEPIVSAASTTTSTTTSTRLLRGASVLILLQIISRAITFIANQVLLRFLTAQLLGVSTQLEVYYLSVIFFARESLRVAIQRQDSSSFSDDQGSKKQNNGAQAVVNLGYLAIGLGFPLSFFFGWLYLNSLSTSTLASAPNLVVALYIYALAAIVELLSEPAFMVMQTRLQFSARAAAESIATFLRCTITLGSAVYGARRELSLGVLPFALGQLGYGTGLLLVYLHSGSGLASRENFSLLPRPISSSGQYLHPPTLKLTSSLLSQSVLKHLLTQGDTFLVSILSSPTSQGVYALANNYGGLLARLVFQPIEESSRSYFSRLLSSPSTPLSDKSSEKQTTETAPTPEKTASQSLLSLLKSYLLLSLIITSLAPVAAPLLLSVVAGKQWLTSGAGATLSLYTYYIPLLAINGITEAFVSSVATEKQVHKQSAWMGVFSLVFASAGFITLKVLDMGAEGLVWANGVNMACRIVWCWGFINNWFKQRGVEADVREVLPSGVGVGAAVVAGSLVRGLHFTSKGGVKEVLIGLGKIAGVGVVFLGVLAFSERQFLLSAFQAIKGRRQV
ncbi:Oligosaccharide translocation protein rft1 [Podospora pseudopauciseta]|uniref:Man(5)GlcNAc(2)-PP-dolichol translocation protein RFT1 n=2 Tax=Podospora TaxID=5144 RepID=A0ABR0HBM9_9PEZI|nr:Oligosaccharide translocation protein rft1 [Podospora pseudopauciseta]KAK4676397.1 Oligosaccharide translocation protein rft1 [Podospora pseudoanserina]